MGGPPAVTEIPAARRTAPNSPASQKMRTDQRNYIEPWRPPEMIQIKIRAMLVAHLGPPCENISTSSRRAKLCTASHAKLIILKTLLLHRNRSAALNLRMSPPWQGERHERNRQATLGNRTKVLNAM